MGWEAKCLLAWRHPVPANERMVGHPEVGFGGTMHFDGKPKPLL